MKARILVAVVWIPLLLLVFCVLPTIATAVLVAGLSAIAVQEMLLGTALVKEKRLVPLSILLALLIPIWSYCGCPMRPALCGLLLYFLALFAVVLVCHKTITLAELFASVFAALLIPLFLASLVRIAQMEYGRVYILVPLVVSFVSDGGAYFAGIFLGKHKMAPHLSPKKTWEGAIGGAIAAVLAMLIFCLVCHALLGCQPNYAYAVLYALIGTVVDYEGDLAFSFIKRQTGIKDFGKFLPGHGGILDRFDSMVFVAPLMELLLVVLPLFGV